MLFTVKFLLVIWFIFCKVNEKTVVFMTVLRKFVLLKSKILKYDSFEMNSSE